MRLIILIICFTNFAFSKEYVCVRLKGDFPKEKYIRIALKKAVEKALIETSYKPKCVEGSKKLVVHIKNIIEKPIAYTSKGRVSSYSLNINISISFHNKKESFSGFAPYGQPSGTIGDINRKKAVDEIIDKIYLNMLKFLSRR